MSRPACNLSWLASRSGPVTDKQIDQIQRWIDADWESHDTNRDAVKLIGRLIAALGVQRGLPRYIDCPECGADPGEQCRSDKSGQPHMDRTHSKRLQAAARRR